jgi:glucose-6-phosphate 1-dehydrogenase
VHAILGSMPEANPFLDPLRLERRLPSCAVVIFGANGDLTKRKLIPALYSLAYERKLPPGFAVIGNSRTVISDEQFRQRMGESVREFAENTPFDEELWNAFAQGLFYVSGSVDDAACFEALAAKLTEVEQSRRTAGNVLFYLSTQPSLYQTAVEGMGKVGLQQGQGWRRLVVEKPFGYDLASARQLSAAIQQVFPEHEVYRIDHYLGKETVQNILAFRFGNGIFEPLWNRRYVNHVQITAAESIGVEGRGSYYQEAGALRDMIQNHLLQVLATVAMEPSAVYEPDAVRDERAQLLRSIRVWKHDEVLEHAVAGQYGAACIGGRQLPGFREEPGVEPEAQTDTYAAATFYIDNWRWAGVPFYVRSGKRLPKRVTDIAIQFNAPPLAVFRRSHQHETPSPNLLLVRIQPDEGISLRFQAKQPGTGMNLRAVSMDFNYGSSYGVRTPTAYETLLLDALAGDSTLYTRQDMVEASWAVVEPILEVWGNTQFPFPNYAAGSWGPEASDAMLARQGHEWRKA